MKTITVGEFYNETKEKFQLKILTPGDIGFDRKITVNEINRPGIALAGHFEHFPFERLQILGNNETFYLQHLPPEKIIELMNKFLSSPNVTCLIVARNLELPQDLLKVAEKKKVAVFQTPIPTGSFVNQVASFLEDKLAPSTIFHGVLMSIYGLGILILGESGIGKSESALELIKRGHLLVADDVVEIKQKSGGILFGSSQELVRHLMEVRGLGIIDVRTIFGMGAIVDSSPVELVVKLEDWDEKKEYDRLGLEDRFTNILGVKVPELVIPMRPGRNIAVIIEVAAMYQRLRNKGYHPAKELDRRLIELMRDKAKEK